MVEERTQTEQGVKDRIVEEVVDKVEQRPAVDAEHEEVRARTEEAVDGLVDAPVQTFTPLLAENKVVGGLLAEQKGGRTDEQAGEPTSEQSGERPGDRTADRGPYEQEPS